MMIETLESRRLLSAEPLPQLTITTTTLTLPFPPLIEVPLPPQSAWISSRGTLIVQGSPFNDVIAVSARGNRIGISFAGSVNWSGTKLQFAARDVKRIQIEGAAGNDRINFDSDTGISTVLLGGNGNDRLTANGANVTLSGGAGDDDLFGEGVHGMTYFGGAGGDRIFTTRGIDTISGGAGDDYVATIVMGRGTVLLDSIERMAVMAEDQISS